MNMLECGGAVVMRASSHSAQVAVLRRRTDCCACLWKNAIDHTEELVKDP
jgi:hypothetical protein